MQVGPFSLATYLVLAVVAFSLAPVVVMLIAGRRWVLPALVLAAVVALVVVSPLGPASFEGIHVVYALLTWGIPAIGVATVLGAFVNPRRRHPRLRVALGALLLIPGAVGYYATNVEPNQLEVDGFTITEPGSTETLKVVVLADIQSDGVGAFQRRAAETASKQGADLVLFAGDLYTGEAVLEGKLFDDFTSLAGSIDAPYGTYFVPGDQDGDDKLPAIVDAADKEFLQQELRVLNIRGMKIGLLGLDTDFSNPDAAALLDDLAERTDLDYKIVLDHKPDAISVTPPGIDLVVAGHTHGGQVQVPFFGPVITLSSIPREQAAGGLFDYSDGRKLFVTRGVGVERGGAPVVRFNAKPQIAVLRIAIAAK